MSELRMSDVFELPLQLASNELAVIDKNDCVVGWDDAFAGKVARDGIVNAVNNHDSMQDQITKLEKDKAELVEMLSHLLRHDCINDHTLDLEVEVLLERMK